MPRKPEQPRSIADLLTAARSYGDAKLALEHHDGEKTGKGYTTVLAAWHNATAELARAARSFASWQRAQEKAEAMRAEAVHNIAQSEETA